MNYYERVQRAIDFIELNLEKEIDLQWVSREAYMSLANLYRMFFSLTGYTIKEYIRRRRIHEASVCLANTKNSILDISITYCFESQAAFTRSFKQLTGLTPGAFRKKKGNYQFERVNVVEEYFEILDKELVEKYPDIKVIKELPPMRVAYYNHFGKGPEGKAWEVLLEWIRKAGLDQENSKMRIFGYDNPPPPRDSIPGQTEYGYEFMATIEDDLIVEDDKVKTKVFPGGRYAVMSISNVGGHEIMKGWERFGKWLAASKYLAGTHQWLEEHLSFYDGNHEHMKIDLYMPLSDQDKNDFTNKINVETVDAFPVAYYRASGEKPWIEAWNVMLGWAEKSGFFAENGKRRFINYTSIPVIHPGKPGFWVKVCMQLDEGIEVQDDKVKTKIFEGGLYACIETDRQNADTNWGLLKKWMFANP